ncbi:hypothetical protein ACWKWU_03615 [Chitinophaga lutea]
MKSWIPLLLLPLSVQAQRSLPVEPVRSPDYAELLKSQGATDTISAGLPAARSFHIQSPGYRPYYGSIRSIKTNRGRIKVLSGDYTPLRIGLLYAGTAEIRRAGKMPSLQSVYAQGRTVNGQLTWRGAETGEMFSFGPALPAHAYSPSLFRTAFHRAHELELQTQLFDDWRLDVRGTTGYEDTYLRNNANRDRSLRSTLTWRKRRWKLNGKYSIHHADFDHSNRNGLFNRAYMNDVLTPPTFDNRSGLPYGSRADAPVFLLRNTGAYFRQTQQIGSLDAEFNGSGWNASVIQTYEDRRDDRLEIYRPGTAFFPGGMATLRNQRDGSYNLRAAVSFTADSDDLKHVVSLRQIFTDDRAQIIYMPQAERNFYQRTANQLNLVYQLSRTFRGFDLRAEGGPQLYQSNTIKDHLRWSAFAGVGGNIYDVLNAGRLELTARMGAVYSEPAIRQSYAWAGLMQWNIADFGRYFPMQEASGFDGLKPLRTNSWSASARFHFRTRFTFSADWFLKDVSDDVFPILDNGAIRLKNIASHRKQGFELQLQQFPRYTNKRFYASNSVTFQRYRHRTTSVADGYEGLPVTGFADVYKTLAVGETPGVMTGSAWLRNSTGERIIGDDGFPLVAPGRKIIGNPQPDFTVKFNNSIQIRNLSFTTTWAWRKGGQMWNGTQAMLDYYGRSAQSGTLRNDTEVFAGVTEDGHPNQQPVRLYDPAKPFEQNRWVRYGPGGVAEDYIRPADCLRLTNAQLACTWKRKTFGRSLQAAIYATNLLLWTAYDGADPDQLLLEQPGSEGLDFFNLPSVATYGIKITLQL